MAARINTSIILHIILIITYVLLFHIIIYLKNYFFIIYYKLYQFYRNEFTVYYIQNNNFQFEPTEICLVSTNLVSCT